MLSPLSSLALGSNHWAFPGPHCTVPCIPPPPPLPHGSPSSRMSPSRSQGPCKNRKCATHTAARPSRPGLLGHQFHQPLEAGAQQKGQGELDSLPLPSTPSAQPFPSPHTVTCTSPSSQHPSMPTLERKPSLPSHGLFTPPRPTQSSHSLRPFRWATLPSTRQQPVPRNLHHSPGPAAIPPPSTLTSKYKRHGH